MVKSWQILYQTTDTNCLYSLNSVNFVSRVWPSVRTMYASLLALTVKSKRNGTVMGPRMMVCERGDEGRLVKDRAAKFRKKKVT